MQAKITKLDPSVELPKYHTSESAGFDIAINEDRLIKAGEVALVKTGLVIQAPEGHFLCIAARSSLALKKGLALANAIGIVDRDYCGPEDEIHLSLYNFSAHAVAVKKGERLAQGLFLPVDQVQWLIAEETRGQSRGGFGSSGGYHG